MMQTSLDFWVVTTTQEQTKEPTWLIYQHKIDRLMTKAFGLYRKFNRQPYEAELRELFTEDELVTIQPYLLWLCPSLNFEA